MEEKISMKLFSDVGMGEVFMSRLFHFQDHILNGLMGLKTKKEIQDDLFSVIFDGLEPAFRSLRDLRKKWNDEKIPEKEKRQLAENVYSYLVIAIKDRFREVAKSFGYDIGFLFQKEEAFVVGCKEFLVRHSQIDQKFIETIKADRNWLNLLVQVRNNVVDHKGGKDIVLVKKLEKYLTLENAEAIFDNCWRLVEDMLLVFSLNFIDKRTGIALLEINEYRADRNHPQRVGWFMVNNQTNEKTN